MSSRFVHSVIKQNARFNNQANQELPEPSTIQKLPPPCRQTVVDGKQW